MPILLLLSYALHHEMVDLQIYIEEKIPEWLPIFNAKVDPYHRTTALGYTGNLKLLDNIVLKVKTDGAPPSLLAQCQLHAI